MSSGTMGAPRAAFDGFRQLRLSPRQGLAFLAAFVAGIALIWGGVTWTLVIALLLWFASGLAAWLFAAAHARYRQTELVARASEARYRAYFDQFADGILVVRATAGGGFIYQEVNKAAEALLGLDAGRAIGRSPRAFLPPHRADVLQARMRQCVAEGRPVAYDDELDAAGGSRKLWIRLAPLTDTDGRVRTLIESVFDITERAAREAHLREAQKMGAVGRLTAGVAHDFNNLLQALLGSLELLIEGTRRYPELHEYAEIALNTAGRGSRLTHHLLAFSGKQILQPQAIDVAKLLRSFGHLLPRTLGPHIDVSVTAPPDLPAAYADSAELETALLNLVLNARDAMPQGGRLTVKASAAAPSADAPLALRADRYVVLSVTDTGAGMDTETVAHACEPFFTTKGAQRSGLGLSMIVGFARQSKGELRLASKPGQGTCAEIWLPCAEALPPAVEQRGQRRHGSQGRVLVVDDTNDVLVTVRAFLSGAGFDVLAAGSGERALTALAAGERFDVLVTDYAMPGINGGELIRRARAFQPDLPALVITGFARLEGLTRITGRIRVLRKPFRKEELVRHVRALTETRTGHSVGPE